MFAAQYSYRLLYGMRYLFLAVAKVSTKSHHRVYAVRTTDALVESSVSPTRMSSGPAPRQT